MERTCAYCGDVIKGWRKSGQQRYFCNRKHRELWDKDHAHFQRMGEKPKPGTSIANQNRTKELVVARVQVRVRRTIFRCQIIRRGFLPNHVYILKIGEQEQPIQGKDEAECITRGMMVFASKVQHSLLEA